MVSLHFGNRVTNYIGNVQNLGSMGWPSLKIFYQRRYSILFSTLMFMPVVPCYADEEWKTLQSIPKQYVFGLKIVVMNRAIKTLYCL